MNLIGKAVSKLESMVQGSGCEDGAIVLKRNSDAPKCQYERGVCIEAHFGGCHGQVVTDYPIQATTRLSSMFSSSLGSPEERSAACAILNAVTGFLCIARKLHACSKESYIPCLSELHNEVAGLRIFCNGISPLIEREFAAHMIKDPQQADVIFIVSDGLITTLSLENVESFRSKKRMIFIGPNFPGICSLLGLEHWCPYGR